MSPTTEFSFQNKFFQRKIIGALSIAFLLPVAIEAQEASSGRLEELTVNATRQPRTIENIAGTVSLISLEDIEREMVDDLDDIARFQPGV